MAGWKSVASGIGRGLEAACFERAGSRWPVVALAFLVVVLPVYLVFAARLVDHANLDRTASDQDSNLRLTYESKDDWWPHRSNFVQPLFPWVASRFLAEDAGEQFVRGKWINLALGLAVVAGCCVAAARALPVLPGFLVVAGATFGVVLQRFHYYQPEPFLYVAFGLAFFGMSAMLFRNSWLVAAATGLAVGLVYLTKGAADPLLACFAGATVLRIAIGKFFPRGDGWSIWRHLAGCGVGAVVFAAVYAPMGYFSHARFGDAFHSLPRYWMWMKLPEQEDKDFQVSLLFGELRSQIPADEFPNAANYIRKFGWADARERMASGVENVWGWFVLPNRNLSATLNLKPTRRDKETGLRYWRVLLPARGITVAALAACAVVLLAGAARARKLGDLPAAPVLAWCAMAAALFAGYFLLFAWYAEIGRGERFILTLQLPLLCGLAWLCDRVARVHRGAVGTWVYGTVLVVLAGHTLAQIGALVAHPWFDI